MNRFKKEIRKRGYTMACDYYPYLPYPLTESVYLESIIVSTEQASIYRCYNVATEKITFMRNMKTETEYAF